MGMIYLYDFNATDRFPDSERDVYIGGIDEPAKDLELAEQYILDMLDYGGKVQYWLMDNGFPANYKVITKNKIRYDKMVPDHKILEMK